MVRRALRQRFVEASQQLGGSASNGRLRDMPGLQDHPYRADHAQLIDNGTFVERTVDLIDQRSTHKISTISAAVNSGRPANCIIAADAAPPAPSASHHRRPVSVS